uniref:Uncharacterized protein n=1 Tax=Rhizophora mucronata TaxID=61149 RepID=A0A2P2QJ25_RHIMU
MILKVYYGRIKYFKIKFHFIKKAQENGNVNLTYYNSKNQMVNILTKGMHRPRFKELKRKLGMQKYGTKEE